MSVFRLLILGGAGAGLVWAYRTGRLAPIADKLGLELGQGKANSAATASATPGQFAPVVPVIGTGELKDVNAWEAMLKANSGALSPWAQRNLDWAAAILKTENSGLNVSAKGGAGELGLYQVKPGTAEQLARMGYTAYPATAAAMTTAAGSIYFGTAYLDYLSTFGKGRDWTIKAYNGGPGWEGLGAAYIAAREAYLDRVEANWRTLYGGAKLV